MGNRKKSVHSGSGDDFNLSSNSILNELGEIHKEQEDEEDEFGGDQLENGPTTIPNKSKWQETQDRLQYNKHSADGSFCQYCRRYIRSQGCIETYLKLTSIGIDEAEENMVRRSMREKSLCPRCFRPNGLPFGNIETTEKRKYHVLSRTAVQLEIVSYWLFRLFVHIPMFLSISVVAIVITLFSSATDRKRKFVNGK